MGIMLRCRLFRRRKRESEQVNACVRGSTYLDQYTGQASRQRVSAAISERIYVPYFLL